MAFRDSILRGYAAILRSMGESVDYQGSGGLAAPVAVTVVWDGSDTIAAQGVKATAFTREDYLPMSPAKGDVIMRGTDRYKVVDPPDAIGGLRDGFGGITLYLRQVSHAPNP